MFHNGMLNVTSLALLTGLGLLFFSSHAHAQQDSIHSPMIEWPMDQVVTDGPVWNEEKPAKEKVGETCESPWAKIPPVRIFPRPGNFFVPRATPGYFSVLDMLTHTYREKPPKYGYPRILPIPPSFFDSDFRYLDDPENKDHDFFDCLHRIHLGDNWLFSTGGQFSWRHMYENNSRLSGFDNEYDLLRTRVYGDLWYKDILRAYVEYIDAHRFNGDLPALPIDVNRSDLLNAFVDVKLGEIKGKQIYLRGGRQELLLGSQRLISPLDWANTRRTFNGVRLFRQGEKFDVDAFWVQPVPPHPSHFDSVDNDRNFGGVWTTYRPKKGHFADFYYLFLDDSSPQRLIGERDIFSYNVHTLGSRYVGDKNGFLWDVEGMVQFGERGNADIFAGAVSVGGGYHSKDLPWAPTFWMYYDYASGDDTPDSVTFGTFNQLFPFGHYYLGWLDLVGRQNIHDVNGHLYLWPTNWTMIWLQYHHFELASSSDALYNAAGVPIRRDPTGAAGSSVGDEIDIVVNFHLDKHSDILLGYSHLFAGSFIRNTERAPGSGDDASLFFVSYSYRW